MTYRFDKEDIQMIIFALDQPTMNSAERLIQDFESILMVMEQTKLDYVYLVGRDINKR